MSQNEPTTPETTNSPDAAGFVTQVVKKRRELSAWGGSLIVNVLILLILWTVNLTGIPEIRFDIVSELLPVSQEKLEPAIAVALVPEVGSNAKNAEMPNSQALAYLQGENPQKKIDLQLEKSNFEVPIPEIVTIPEPNRDELAAPVQTIGETIDVGGTEGALDYLTREIESSLNERKTLVIWLFDASQSLNQRRELIASRFESIYKQLKDRDKELDTSLQTIVVSYGQKTTFLTPRPTSDIQKLVDAVRRIQPDESGKEFLFTALNDTMRKWKRTLETYTKYASHRRNVRLIVVTDERGDDFAGKNQRSPLFLDQTILELRRLKIKMYCVGNAAVFGRRKGYVSFTDKNGQFWNDLEVDQGPETVAPQCLQIPFWGKNFLNGRLLSSHCGPYALTRACHETGGPYLITEHSQRAARFPEDLMRNYRPYYGTIQKYRKAVSANQAKSALSRAANMIVQQRIPKLRIAFTGRREATLRREISAAQRPMARLNSQLKELDTVLKRGEKSRPTVREPRWQAGYDLAMGRLMAARVRAFGYQTVLAEMASSPLSFKNKKNNTWFLRPSRDWDSYPPAVKKLAKKSHDYLKRVIDKHPNTPWALLAEYELGTEFGWQWQEGYIEPPPKPLTREQLRRLQLANENQPGRPSQPKPVAPPKRPKL